MTSLIRKRIWQVCFLAVVAIVSVALLYTLLGDHCVYSVVLKDQQHLEVWRMSPDFSNWDANGFQFEVRTKSGNESKVVLEFKDPARFHDFTVEQNDDLAMIKMTTSGRSFEEWISYNLMSSECRLLKSGELR